MLASAFNYTKVFTRAAMAICLALVILLLIPVKNNAFAGTGINRQINFQGKLVNNPNGTNVNNNSYTVIFTIYDRDSGGTALWTETQTVTTTDGIFRVALGSVTPFPANFNFNWSGLYLGIKVNADSEMTPRIQLAAVPFAFNAEKVSGLTVQDENGNASTSGVLQVANAKTVKFGNAFDSGANSLTFSTTGNMTLSFGGTGSLQLADTTTNQTFTNKLIGSTGLTFSGATTDITTATNEDFIISPNGSGKVGINTSTLLSSIDLRGNPVIGGTLSIASISGTTSFAGLVVDNNGLGDIFTASKSGLSLFTVKNNGSVGILTSTPTATLDIAGTASIGGQLTFRSTFGAIQTTAFQQLTIGGSTTGKIALASFNSPVIAVGATGGIVFGGYTGSGSGCNLKTDASGNVVCSTDLTAAGVPTPFNDQVTSGVITANNLTEDFIFGSLSSSSARFKLTANNAGAGTLGVASISGKTSFAALVVDNSGVGDIFTASKAGATRFTIDNLGNVSQTGNLTFLGSTGTVAQIFTSTNQNLSINASGNGLIGINTDGVTPLANFDVRANVGTIAVASVSGATSYAALTVDNSGVGDIITASASGATRFVVRQDGSVGVGGSQANSGFTFDVVGNARIGNNTPNSDILKDTSADFTVSGSSITPSNSVDTTGDDMTLVTDMITAGGSIAAPANGPSTGQNIGAGSIAFQRPDSKFVVVAGAGSNVTRIYDHVANTYTPGPILTANATTGSFAYQRQNGTVLIAHGGATTTSIYSPGTSNNVGTIIAGPALTANTGAGVQTLRLSDGKLLVILGGASATTNLYDPTVGTTTLGNFRLGPGLTTTVTTGSFAFETIYGKWIIGVGGGTTTNVYDPTTGLFSVGPSLTTGTPGAGTFVIQRPDYTYLVAIGGSANTQIYNPITNTFTPGPTLSAGTFGAGAHAFQRSNGTWAVMIGGASVTVFNYDPINGGTYGSFSAGTNLFAGNTVGAGALTFQRPDGKYVVVTGNSAQTTTIYDGGWNTSGSWTSEPIANSNISTYSAIMWQANPQSANNNARLDVSTIDINVKTAATTGGLSASPWVSIPNSGDLIGGTVNPAGAVQIQVNFSAPIRSYPQLVTEYINQSNIWGGEGSTFNRRSLLQPTIFSIRIQNPLVQYGGLASDPQYGRNFATAGAILEGVVTDNNNQMTLAVNRNLPVSTPAAGFIIASASANTGVAVTTGSFAFSLPNGQVILGVGGATTTRLYDPDSNSFNNGPNLPNNSGAGAHVFQLPNGNYFIILGGGKNTAIYDTQANVFYAGPSLATAVGAGSNTFQRPDGLFINVAAGATPATNIIDPFLLTVTQGPFLSQPVTNGSWNLRRPDGRILVYTGATTITNVYDAATNAFVVGPVPSATMIGAGGMLIQLSTGRVLWIRGTGGTTTNLLDPVTNLFSAGPASGITLNVGSFAIPRPDGKVLIGGATNTTTVYDPYGTTAGTSGQFSTTANAPTLPCSVGAGGLVFQRPDGTYVLICGNSTQNTAVIDAGWNLGGSYISEQIYEPNLSTTNAMFWQNVGQGNIYVKYRTAATQAALGVSSWKDLSYSGSNITPTAGDVWFQARFDFSGNMQDAPGAKSKVWPGADAGGLTIYYRTVQTPIMSYWKLLNSPTPTLLTLTSGGSNAFRFSADGQAYTSAGGAWNSGGADLAERYTSSQSLQAGEVVVGDRANAQNVIRSTDSYQTNIMGVVSTQPGFVAGSYTPNSYPIALVGRVPVKISNENGEVKAGDYLTSASIPGYAMKATVAGRVLGTALEDFNPSVNDSACPKDGAGSLITTKCGSIMAFINLTNYNGENIVMLMADKGFTTPDINAGIKTESGLDSYMNSIAPKDYSVLSFLENLKTQEGVEAKSSLLTGTLNAVNQVISPEIVAGIITAKTIRADRIEGLEIFTNQLASLSSQMAVLSSSTQSGELLSSSSGQINIGSLHVNGLAEIVGDSNTKGNSVIEGMLTVLKSITAPNLLITDFASFFGDVLFKGNTKFEGRPTFNSDTAGFAVISKGETQVTVNFDNEYQNQPIVTASIAIDKSTDISSSELETQVLSGQIAYVITEKSTKSFVIKLNKPLDKDISFSWVALSVDKAKTQTNSSNNQNIILDPSSTQSAAFKSIINQINN